MRSFQAISKRVVLGLLIAIPFAVSAPGQTTSPPSSPPPAAKKPPTSATPQMIDEAIQRSQARTARERDQHIPEQFGSEEPFTPAKTN